MAASLEAIAQELSQLRLAREIEQFLYAEAEILDQRRFDDWLDLFADDARYWMPMRRNVDSDELHYWLGTYGDAKAPGRHGASRREVQHLGGVEAEAARRAAAGYGGARQRVPLASERPEQHHAHFGVTIVSCERGDMRQSPDGVFVFDEEGKREIAVPFGRGTRDNVLDEFYDAIVHDRPLMRDGRWGRATIEACVAILQSSAEKREITLSRQAPFRDELLPSWLGT